LYIDFTQDYESPTSFFRWAAYAAVAAVLRDNVWKQQGHMNTYPNIYVLLLATSAVHRKSVPTGLTGDLVREVGNTKLIRGRTSIQAVLDDLAGIETDRNTGTPIKGGSCLLCAEELAAFIVQSPEAIPILTDIYDARKEWTSSLRGSGKFKVSNICVTMLAASNETHLKEVYTELAIYGGLLGRTFFVKPNEFRKANPLLKDEKKKYDPKPLVDSLKIISRLKGEMIFDNGVEEEYSKWYTAFRDSYKDKPDKSGIMGRIHTGVLKLSMIIGVSSEYDKIVKIEHFYEALEQCLAILPNYDTFVLGQGKGIISEQAGIFINALWDAKNHTAIRRDILFQYWSEFDAETLDKIVVTLEQAGMVRTSLGDQVEYQLTEKAQEKFNKHTRKP
jgi:hypothetical protein